MTKKQVTRRDFIKSGAAAVGALYMGMPGLTKAQEAKPKKSKVVLIRDENVIDKLYKPDAEKVQQMLDDAVTTLLNEPDPVKAWQHIIEPNDLVGIKTNVWRYLATPSELEQAIKKRIMGAGVNEKNIGIKDRGLYDDPIFSKASALINVRPMRTHHWSGVGSCLKNVITYSPTPYIYHDDSCADLGKLWKLPLVEGKVRLNILVMFTPLFHGVGPHHFSPQYTWAYKGMIVGVDPVAVDSVGVQIIQAKRKEFFKEDRPLNPPAKHIQLADTRWKIGNADPKNIELIKLGWDKDILI